MGQTSQIFTFYSLLEYIICNYLYRVKRRIKDIKEIAKERKMVKMPLTEEKSSNSQSSNFSQEQTMSRDSKDDKAGSVVINKSDILAVGGVCKIDRLLLKNNGTLLISDEGVEVFSRYAYPIAYAALCSLFYYLEFFK